MDNKPSDIVLYFFTDNNNVSSCNITLKGLIYTSLFLLFKVLRSLSRQLVNTSGIKRGSYAALVNTFNAITSLYTAKVITFNQKDVNYLSFLLNGNKKMTVFRKIVFTYTPERDLFKTLLLFLKSLPSYL